MSLLFQERGIYGLLGPNGAGKTTLLKLICGLLFPLRGTVRVNDMTPCSRRPELLREIFFLGETFHLPPISIEAYEKTYAGFYPRFDHQQFQKWIHESLLSKANDLHRLSYGQRKKFIFVFGLATNSRILILDEPSNGIDIPSKGLMANQLIETLEMERNKNRIVIVSTHQVADFQDVFSAIHILHKGQTLLNASVETLMSHFGIRRSVNQKDMEKALYWEKTQEGYKGLVAKSKGSTERLSFEFFFKAAIEKSDQIQAMMEKI